MATRVIRVYLCLHYYMIYNHTMLSVVNHTLTDLQVGRVEGITRNAHSGKLAIYGDQSPSSFFDGSYDPQSLSQVHPLS